MKEIERETERGWRKRKRERRRRDRNGGERLLSSPNCNNEIIKPDLLRRKKNKIKSK